MLSVSRAVRFFSQYFMPELGQTSELLSGVALKLCELGFVVDAVAAQPNYHGARRLPKVLEQGGVTVRRVWSTTLNKNSIVGRVLNSATFAMTAFLAALRTPRSTLLIAVTNPPLLLWVCLAAHFLRRRRYILVIHDVYPDIVVKLGLLDKASPITWLWTKLNRASYRFALRIVVLGRDMQQVIAAELPPAMRTKIVIIPNWADGKNIRPRPREGHNLIKAIRGEQRFVVQYSGNIGRFHEIDTILRAADYLKEEPFLFFFIGTGHQVSQVEDRIKDNPDGNVCLMPFQPTENLGTTLTACDVGLVTLKGNLAGLAVPSKLYGVLAAGKPVVVVGPDDCEPAFVVREGNCGFVVSAGDVGGFVGVLRMLQSEPGLRSHLGRQARTTFERCFDISKIVPEWEHMLNNVD